MNKKITNTQAFNLAEKLNNPDILGIKDTEFALAVYKNLKTIIEHYEKLQKLITPSKEWEELTKDVKTEEEHLKLKEQKGNEKIFSIREKQIAKYNEALISNYPKSLIKVKIKNLNTKLSAIDITNLESMLIL